MNFHGLLPHQPQHAKQLCAALAKNGAALDASDTGTGKTYVALCICRELGIVPLVLGPKNAKNTWERAAKLIGTEIEYVNYERVRGRRALRGGIEVDTVQLTQNSGQLFDTPCTVVALRSGKPVFRKQCDWSDATDYVNAGLRANGQQLQFISEPGEYAFGTPFLIGQENLSESDWIQEKKYGSGSFIVWKNRYTMIIFDEVHRCGGSKSLNSKLLIAAKRQAQFILAISATAADDPQQMKALGYALGLHQLGGKVNGFRSWLLRHGCNLDKETNRVSLSLNTNRQKAAFSALNREIFPARGARMRKCEIPDFPHSKLDVKLLDSSAAAAKLVKSISELHKTFLDSTAAALESGLWVKEMQALELLMVPDIVEIAEDVAAEARVAVFVSYQATRLAVTQELQKKFGRDKVGWVDGTQVGERGAEERQYFIDQFQANNLAAIVLNSNAGGEAVSLHDPTGQIERVALITPQDSGRRLKQILGRVDRASGANSLQLLLYLAGTEQEKTATRVSQRLTNIELLNDADLRFV